MVEPHLQLNPVFLAASIPDPHRDKRYFETGDSIAIRNAVIALVTVVLPKSKLVFGGHPAITPMVKWIADQFRAFDRVRLFQSKFFRDKYVQDLKKFRYEEIDAVPGDREASLLKMRTAMLESEPFSAAFFIGGMDGVEREYDLLRQKRPGIPRFPVYTTGAAAHLLWKREQEILNEVAPPLRNFREMQLEELRTKSGYAALFTNLLQETLLRG